MNILVEINSAYYYCSSDSELTNTHINNTYYIPRLKTYPTISRQVGSMFFGVNVVNSINLDFINTDGYFDSIYSLFINKNIILRAGEGNILNNYAIKFSGKITNISRDNERMSITCEDVKSSFNKNISLNYYSLASYPNINTININKPIPQMWGINKKMQCVCINELESPPPANYTFKIVDTSLHALSSIDAVYLNDLAVSYSNTNLANATFTISSATLGTGNFEKVTASATNSVNNPVDIIQDIIDTAIVGFSWNTFEMTNTKAQGFITSYYQNNLTDILSAINIIMKDTDLILYSDNEGISSLRYFNSSRAVSRVIQNHEYTDPPNVSNNITEFASSILVTYLPARSLNQKQYHRVSTYETEASTWYGDKREIQIDTNLTTTTDATLKANKILELSKIFRETYTRNIRMDLSDSLNIFDFVAANPGMRDVNTDYAVYSTYEILGISDNYEKKTRQLTLRYISPYLLINKFEYLTDHLNQNVLDHDYKPIVTGDYNA